MKDPDLAISWLLRIGVLLSASVIMVGMIVHLAGGNGRTIITAGLLILIATPVARVAFSIFIFLKEKDRLYVAITSAVLAILLFSFFVGKAAGAELPSVPPLPSGGWPSAQVAEPFARALMAREPAAELAKRLAANPELMPGVLRNLGTAMMSSDASLVAALTRYVHDVTRASTMDTRAAASIVVLDPVRFLNDAAFRKRMSDSLPAIMAGMPTPRSRAILDELTASGSLDFAAFERVAAANGVVRRASSERRVPFDASIVMPDDVSGPIETSFFSLSSAFFKPEEIRRFLEAVHAASPKRQLVVLGDRAIRDALPKGVVFVDDHSRAVTPWPRDPFIVAHRSDRVVFVSRPNVQRDREEDRNMARALVDDWGDAMWTIAPIPFHNGHLLLTPTTVWISIFSLEPQIGTARERVREAANALQQLFRRPVRFVHPLDDLDALGGGAGFDLDSIVTILPPSNALVGDIDLGVKYGGKKSAKAEGLQQFLDIVAKELQRDGLTVRRLPLLLVAAAPADYLVTWNNVVLENRRAEGFASRIPDADAYAKKTFAAAGYKLVLFPPLRRSIELGGGYRCASNHVRPPGR